MAVLRSLLFVPGNQGRMLEKAMGSRPDALVPDLEDSVPVDEKVNAREVTASYLPQLAQAGPLVIPRVNSLDTGLTEAELTAVVGPHIYGVSVGKIYTPQDVLTISGMIDRLEEQAGVPVGQTKLVLWRARSHLSGQASSRARCEV
ncbi:aldolase/citrate lyase family protein, partial [Candidatus Entotheonella palauensis]